VGDLDTNITETILKDYFAKIYSSVTGAKVIIKVDNLIDRGGTKYEGQQGIWLCKVQRPK